MISGVFKSNEQILTHWVVKAKHRQQCKDFVKNLTNYEKDIDELEARIDSIEQTHSAQIALKDRMIQDRETTIVHQNSLIEQYKIALAPSGIRIDHENGELILGSIGKRGFEENYEEDRVRELKRLKVALQEEVSDLAAKRLMFEGQVKGKGKLLGDGERLENDKAKILDQCDGLDGQSFVQDEQV